MSEEAKSDSNAVPIGLAFAVTMALMVAWAIYVGVLRKEEFKTESRAVIDRYGMIPEFSLVDQNGEHFGLRNVEGKVWVANFIFTSCATECPLLSRRMQEISEIFEEDDQVELVSISIDPRTDSPERLLKYSEAFGSPPNWSFLTGETKVIEFLSSEGFKVTNPGEHAEKGSIRRTRQMLHSREIVVVDDLGVVRYYANGMHPKVAKEVAGVVDQLLARA